MSYPYHFLPKIYQPTKIMFEPSHDFNPERPYQPAPITPVPREAYGAKTTQNSPPKQDDLKHNDSPVCPHCGAVYRDAWEIPFDSGEDSCDIDCGNCEQTYEVFRNISVTYCTYAIDLEERVRMAEKDRLWREHFIKNGLATNKFEIIL